MKKAFIGLGSNLNDPIHQVQTALNVLAQERSIELLKVSNFYRNPAFGVTEQPDFVNAVAKVKTSLSAKALLEKLLEIESRLGRKRTIKWGPRIIDLDLLLFEDKVSVEPFLQLPHPGITTRACVACLLDELQPDLTLPDGSSIAEVSKSLDRDSLIQVNPLEVLPC